MAGEGGGGGWAGLSRSMSDGAAWQAHAKSPSVQVQLELVSLLLSAGPLDCSVL